MNPMDACSLLGTAILPKKVSSIDYRQQLSFHLNMCSAGSEAMKKKSQYTDEPRHSTQSGVTTSPDTIIAPRIDRPPDKTKSPQRQAKKPHGEFRLLSATFRLNKKHGSLYKQLHFRDYENHSPLDTGAIQSSMTESEK